MPLELQIIRASEFVRLGAHGHFDLAASKAALAVLVGACRKRGINQALMDLRQLQPGPKPVFSRADLIEIVNTFREIGFTHQQRLAILYHSDPHRRARLFAFLSKLHGWTVQAFGDFEEALHWLSSGGETVAQPARSATGKPIRVRTRESVEAASNSATPPAIKIKSKPAKGGIKKVATTSQRRRQGVIRIIRGSVGLVLAGTLMAAA
jgi:hypothetical protein